MKTTLATANAPVRRSLCCTSPAAICYWVAISLIAWGALSIAGIFWHPLHWYSASTTLFAMSIGCVANWLRNRPFHCAITGPLFLVGAIIFLIADRSIGHVNSSLIWSLLLVGTGIAFFLEWRYARRSSCQGS